MEYASYVPLNCPPNAAMPASGTYFRFAKVTPPDAEDFKSYYELKGPDGFSPNKLCQACGLSVFCNEEDVRSAIQASPFLRKKIIVKASLDEDWGVVQATKGQWEGHHTWWVAKDKRPELIFEEAQIT